MMTRVYVTTYICDQCGKKIVAEESEDGFEQELYYSLSLPAKRVEGEKFPHRQHLDFCSLACVLAWTQKQLEQAGDAVQPSSDG